ncbi:MAG: glycoside hydrolase family 1 protein [Succinivibrio sp.]
MPILKPFVTGAASAAAQVEGAASEGGRQASIWDEFCAQKGRILDGSDCSVACDEYHRYEEDIGIARDIGLKALRFSIAWPRVIREDGSPNPEGLSFYDRFTDCLLEHGIEPCPTLFHWDLPLSLYKKGGFQNEAVADEFYKYAKAVLRMLKGRARTIFTINEPQCISGLGYVTGEHAPGLRCGAPEFLRVLNGLLRCHGRAMSAIRDFAPGARAGAAVTGAVITPENANDVEAVARENYRVTGDPKIDFWRMALWSDAVAFGRWADGAQDLYGSALPCNSDDQWAEISQKVDFWAMNIYNSSKMTLSPDGALVRVPRPRGAPKTAAQWPVTPECLYWGPRYAFERYGIPVMITETGMSGLDYVSEDGRVHDTDRIQFLRSYLRELRRASDDGVDLAGLFIWSLTDNFEWSKGYTERFGLVHVDYATQKRTPKDSAKAVMGMIDEILLS